MFLVMLRVAVVAMAVLVTGRQSVAAAEEVLLWPADHSANQGEGEPSEEVAPDRLVIRHSPSLIPFLPAGGATEAAVMICPGGGYRVLAIDHEGYQIARWMNERGIAAFVLKYRCGGSPNTHPAPLTDALRGMQLIRSRAEEWNIDPEKLGVMGFSAGGHLASCVSTLSDDGQPEASNEVAGHGSRPAFSVLVYPVISMDSPVAHVGSRTTLLGDHPDNDLKKRLSTDLQVLEQTPPTFLIHATDDRAVPVKNSLLYYEALIAAKVPAELHVFEHGGHGFGMRKRNQPVDHWPELLDRWLRQRGLAR